MITAVCYKRGSRCLVWSSVVVSGVLSAIGGYVGVVGGPVYSAL